MKRLALLILLVAPPALAADPIGLGIYVVNGMYSNALDTNLPSELHSIDGVPRYLEEFDVSVKASTLEGVKGAFPLDWTGLVQVPCSATNSSPMEDWRTESDGFHRMRSACYRGARWMNDYSTVEAIPLDAAGHVAGVPLVGLAGLDGQALPSDDFWERRYVARVVTHTCLPSVVDPTTGDCSNPEANTYAESLVHLRVQQHPNDRAFAISPQAASLDVYITSGLRALKVANVPVHHDAPNPAYGFGLRTSLAVVNPPTRGFFLPGETVQLQVTHTDAAGHRFFAPGAMPSYGQSLFEDPAAAGMRYLIFNADPILYWHAKILQSDMAFSMGGALQHIMHVGTTPITPAQLFAQQITEADVTHDGFSAVVQIIPSTTLVFPCLFALGGLPGGDLNACFVPTSDTMLMQLPADAQTGTWTSQIKARRVWEGQPSTSASVVSFQVGSKTPTAFTPPALPSCARSGCHDSALTQLQHTHHGFALTNGKIPSVCGDCHTKGYYFEPDADLGSRLTQVHLLSHRFGSLGGKSADVTLPAGY